MKLREEAQEFHIQQFSRTIPGIFNKMFILLCGTRWGHKKGFERLSLKKKVKKSFYFVQTMSQFSMMKTSFFPEKLGTHLTNRRGLVMKKNVYFSLWWKNNNDKSFNKKKKLKREPKLYLFFFRFTSSGKLVVLFL